MLVCFRMIIYICEVLFRKNIFKLFLVYGNKGHKNAPKHINSAKQLPPETQQKQYAQMPLP